MANIFDPILGKLRKKDVDAESLQGSAIDSTVGSPSDGDIIVYRDAGSDWVLEAKPAGGSNPALNDVTDVVITSVADNEVLAYDSGGNWINQTASEAGLASASHTHTESDITDLGSYITASSSDSLTNKTIDADNNTISNIALGAEATGALGDLSNVTESTVGNDEVLQYVTDHWENQTLAEAGISAVGHAHATSDITSGTFADARVAESNVTQHEGALTITESQISDLGSYITTSSTDTLTNKSLSDSTTSIVDNLDNTKKLQFQVSGVTTATTRTLTVPDANGTIQLQPSEGGFADGDKTKLDGIETGADVTDTANVTSAGALMDSEVDADLKTLSLPANTTISTFGASLIDDADAGTARTTLGVDPAGTDNSTNVTLAGTPDYITISGQQITRNQIDLTADVTGVLPEANLPNASTTAEGVVELATVAETDTGTDSARVITPDGLAGSNYGERVVSILLNDSTALTSGDGKAYFRVPSSMNGFDLVEVSASRVSGTGTPSFQVHNVTDAVDMLSTNITIDSGETDSSTAVTPPVINTSNDNVSTGERLRIDVDDAGTSTLWSEVQLIFRLP